MSHMKPSKKINIFEQTTIFFIEFQLKEEMFYLEIIQHHIINWLL